MCSSGPIICALSCVLCSSWSNILKSYAPQQFCFFLSMEGHIKRQGYSHTTEYSKSLLVIIAFYYVLSTDTCVTSPCPDPLWGRGALRSSFFISQSQILCSQNGWGSSAVPLLMLFCTQIRKEIKQLWPEWRNGACESKGEEWVGEDSGDGQMWTITRSQG